MGQNFLTLKDPNACFQCGQQGHFARNCPQRQQHNNYANLIDFNDNDQKYYDNYTPQQPVNPLGDIKARLTHLSGDDKAKLAEEMGIDEDFPTAWSGWHWSSKVAMTMCIYRLGNLWQYDSTFTPLLKELKPSL